MSDFLVKTAEYILLIFISGSNATGAMQMKGYKSEASCQKQGQAIVKRLKQVSSKIKTARVSFRCVKK